MSYSGKLTKTTKVPTNTYMKLITKVISWSLYFFNAKMSFNE